MSDLIRDPFDSSEAIMPSGNRGRRCSLRQWGALTRFHLLSVPTGSRLVGRSRDNSWRLGEAEGNRMPEPYVHEGDVIEIRGERRLITQIIPSETGTIVVTTTPTSKPQDRSGRVGNVQGSTYGGGQLNELRQAREAATVEDINEGEA